MQVQKRKCENNTAVCPALSLGWSENMQEARPLLLVNVSVPLWECRSAQTAPCSGSSTEDKSLRGKKKNFFFFVLVAVQGTCWVCRLCGWLGRRTLAGTGGGDSSLKMRLGNSKRLASFPGF